MFQKLCDKHKEMIKDLAIGYPISHDALNEMWELMHNLYLVKYGEISPYKIMSILEKNEYM